MTDLERITQSVEKRAEKICQVNDRVWEYAELAFHEFRSADTICQVLEEEGFTVERGLAGIPTCFTGTYVHGSGKPVMGILGEFDALSSLSQQAATTTPQPVVPAAPDMAADTVRWVQARWLPCLPSRIIWSRPERTEPSSISAVLPKRRRLQAVHGARRTV